MTPSKKIETIQGLISDAYKDGALKAMSFLMQTHDQPVMAADVLNAMGLEDADCSALDEYDKKYLQKVQGELGGRINLRGLGD